MWYLNLYIDVNRQYGIIPKRGEAEWASKRNRGVNGDISNKIFDYHGYQANTPAKKLHVEVHILRGKRRHGLFNKMCKPE